MEPERSSMPRRTLLKLSAAAAIGAMADGWRPLLANPVIGKHPIGIQLYTVMPLLSRDFEGTIKQIAAIGYKEVETIGSFGLDPGEVKTIFDRYGLSSPSQHIASNELYSVFDKWVKRTISIEERDAAFRKQFDFDRIEETIPAAIASAKAMGQKYVIWQSLDPQQVDTKAKVDRLIRVFDRAAEICRRSGTTFGFHNHTEEFAKVDRVSAYDRILAETDPATLKMEMDFYWMKKGGLDSITYLRRNPGRYRLCHMKDMDKRGNIVPAGSGEMITKELIDVALQAGVEHFFVETDTSAVPLWPERNAYDYMQELF